MKIQIDDRYSVQSYDHGWTVYRMPDEKKEDAKERKPVAVAHFRTLSGALHNVRARLHRDPDVDVLLDGNIAYLIGLYEEQNLKVLKAVENMLQR